MSNTQLPAQVNIEDLAAGWTPMPAGLVVTARLTAGDGKLSKGNPPNPMVDAEWTIAGGDFDGRTFHLYYTLNGEFKNGKWDIKGLRRMLDDMALAGKPHSGPVDTEMNKAAKLYKKAMKDIAVEFRFVEDRKPKADGTKEVRPRLVGPARQGNSVAKTAAAAAAAPVAAAVDDDEEEFE